MYNGRRGTINLLGHKGDERRRRNSVVSLMGLHSCIHTIKSIALNGTSNVTSLGVCVSISGDLLFEEKQIILVCPFHHSTFIVGDSSAWTFHIPSLSNGPNLLISMEKN